ncbi:hypothetical protein [Neptuniibacter sp. QD37_11]|uniref:hypothetical protein n=1 Tax=Neptuniibacter sp. QD37_11 TaxID=3398209 RepID=UPI0039F4C0E1
MLISKLVYRYSNAVGHFCLPDGIVCKMGTLYMGQEPFINTYIFEDGSEINVSFSGQYYLPSRRGWEPEEITTPVLAG